jgi:hypothetical protein
MNVVHPKDQIVNKLQPVSDALGLALELIRQRIQPISNRNALV